MFTSYEKMFFNKTLLHLVSFSVSFINMHNCDNDDIQENVKRNKRAEQTWKCGRHNQKGENERKEELHLVHKDFPCPHYPAVPLIWRIPAKAAKNKNHQKMDIVSTITQLQYPNGCFHGQQRDFPSQHHATTYRTLNQVVHVLYKRDIYTRENDIFSCCLSELVVREFRIPFEKSTSWHTTSCHEQARSKYPELGRPRPLHTLEGLIDFSNQDKLVLRLMRRTDLADHTFQ